jgi:hypothetical protein
VDVEHGVLLKLFESYWAGGVDCGK